MNNMEYITRNIPTFTDFLEYKEKDVLSKCSFRLSRMYYLNTERLKQKIALRKIRFFVKKYLIDDYTVYNGDTILEDEWNKHAIVKIYMREYFKYRCYDEFATLCNWKIPDRFPNFIDEEMPEIGILAEKDKITRREFFNLIKKLVNYTDVLQFVGL